jgi:hypothetical protein
MLRGAAERLHQPQRQSVRCCKLGRLVRAHDDATVIATPGLTTERCGTDSGKGFGQSRFSC